MPDRLRGRAAEIAYSLGISLYIRDGRIWQTGPGERIDPAPGCKPRYDNDSRTRAAQETAP